MTERTLEGLALRPASEADLDLLRAVYASAREEELAPLPWSAPAKQAFLASQFALQHDAYHQAYPEGRFLVIEREGTAIGRLYLGDLPGELRVIDIALLPQARGQGIGTRLMRQVLAEADERGLAVTLHVERWNPAWRLYARLGFVEVEERGAYVLLRRDLPVS